MCEILRVRGWAVVAWIIGVACSPPTPEEGDALAAGSSETGVVSTGSEDGSSTGQSWWTDPPLDGSSGRGIPGEGDGPACEPDPGEGAFEASGACSECRAEQCADQVIACEESASCRCFVACLRETEDPIADRQACASTCCVAGTDPDFAAMTLCTASRCLRECTLG